jgi:hypothetical protein
VGYAIRKEKGGATTLFFSRYFSALRPLKHSQCRN